MRHTITAILIAAAMGSAIIIAICLAANTHAAESFKVPTLPNGETSQVYVVHGDAETPSCQWLRKHDIILVQPDNGYEIATDELCELEGVK